MKRREAATVKFGISACTLFGLFVVLLGCSPPEPPNDGSLHSDVLAVAVCKDKVISTGSDYRVCTVDGQTLQVQSEARLPSQWGNGVAVRPGRLECAAACSDGSIVSYQPGSTEVLSKGRIHSEWALCVAFQDPQVIVSGGRDHKVIFSTWDSGERLFDLEADFWVECVALSPDGQFVAAGCWRGTVSLWSLADRKLVKSANVVGRHYAVLSLAFSPDSRFLYIGTQDDDVTRRTIPEFEEDMRLQGHTDCVSAMDFLDATLITASNDGTIRSWNVQTGKLMDTVSPGIGALKCMAIAPDGKCCYVGSRLGVLARSELPKTSSDGGVIATE